MIGTTDDNEKVRWLTHVEDESNAIATHEVNRADAMAYAYQAGADLTQIATAAGLARETVRKALLRRGVTMRRQGYRRPA